MLTFMLEIIVCLNLNKSTTKFYYLKGNNSRNCEREEIENDIN